MHDVEVEGFSDEFHNSKVSIHDYNIERTSTKMEYSEQEAQNLDRNATP